MNDQSYVSIFVKDMRVSVRVGLLEEEKQAPQALDVSVELMAAPDYLAQGVGGDIVDYAKVYEYVLNWQDRPHVELLEALAAELVEYGFSFDAVQAVRVRVAKPDIFDQAAQAGVEVFLRRGGNLTDLVRLR